MTDIEKKIEELEKKRLHTRNALEQATYAGQIEKIKKEEREKNAPKFEKKFVPTKIATPVIDHKGKKIVSVGEVEGVLGTKVDI